MRILLRYTCEVEIWVVFLCFLQMYELNDELTVLFFFSMTSSVQRTHHANVPQAQRGLQTGFSFTDSRIALGRDIMLI